MPDTPEPMTDGDIETPPAGTSFQPAEPLKDQGVEFEPEEAGGKPAGVDAAKQTVKDHVGSFGQQAGDRVRQFAEDGKARAGSALDQLAQMLTDAADQVDDKLGAQYGQYARTAAGTVQNFAGSVRDKDVDALVEDARALVQKSPAIAVGAAAAVGFVIARLVQSGIDETRA